MLEADVALLIADLVVGGRVVLPGLAAVLPPGLAAGGRIALEMRVLVVKSI